MPTAVVLPEPAADLEIRDLPTPEPGAGEVVVEVSLAGVNFWEIMQRHGRVPAPERGVPGREGVGVVRALGADVEGLSVGQRVAWSNVGGSYAAEVTGPAEAFTPVPDAVDDATAAGLLFQGVTAHYLATDTWALGEGDTAVVTAAAGGVGTLLTQLLTARGVEVIAMVSSPEKAAVAKAAGAVQVLSYDDELPAKSAAAIFDAIGGDLPRRLLPGLRPRGAMVLYGTASGSVSDLGAGDLGQGSYFLTQAAGKDYSATPEERRRRSEDLLELAASGDLTVQVGGTWPLAEAAQALESLESRASTGKLLLKI